MATRTVTNLVDDLDGSTADENVSFGLDRVDYEIDLSAEHAETLREVLARYVSAARRTGGRRAARAAQPPRSASSSGAAGTARSRATNTEIRAWATGHGVALAERGRIPARVIEAYNAADPSLLSGTNGAPTAGETEDSAPASNSTAHDGASASAASKAAAPSSADESSRGRDGLTAAEREAVRAWAVEQGIEVKSRGQLKKDLVASYQALAGPPAVAL